MEYCHRLLCNSSFWVCESGKSGKFDFKTSKERVGSREYLNKTNDSWRVDET
jgi:hypothetical protein